MISLNSRLQTALHQLKSSQSLPTKGSREEMSAPQAQVIERFTRMPLDTFQQYDNGPLDQDPRQGFMSRQVKVPGSLWNVQSEMSQAGDTAVLLETIKDAGSGFSSTKYYEFGPQRTISLIDSEQPGQGTHTEAVYLDKEAGTYLLLRG